MKYGQYLESKKRPEWRDQYIDYQGLRELVWALPQGTSSDGFSPRATSLSAQRFNSKRESVEERFFSKLENDLAKINAFTQEVVQKLRADLAALHTRALSAKLADKETKDAMMEEGHILGEEFLQLEKYVNVNYMGFHKILKKHDKCLPQTPCRQFYVARLHQQPWVQGNYSDLLVSLSNIYAILRDDAGKSKDLRKDSVTGGVVKSTTQYWVWYEDVSIVKNHVVQNLPVFQQDKKHAIGDAQLINSVYLDNATSLELYHARLEKKPGALALRIRWYGNASPTAVFIERKIGKAGGGEDGSLKARFMLPEEMVIPFLDGEYTPAKAMADMEAAASKTGRAFSPEEQARFLKLFTDVFNAIDSKQLKPMIRTQTMRTTFQAPYDPSIRVTLDTNLCMIKENIKEGVPCSTVGRWYRDPEAPIARMEITDFPYAVLEIKAALGTGQPLPAWIKELLDSGYLMEVNRFSKFIHGMATLFPEMVRAVPYWVDDEAVQASMMQSSAQTTRPSAAMDSNLAQALGKETAYGPAEMKHVMDTYRKHNSYPSEADGDLREPLLADRARVAGPYGNQWMSEFSAAKMELMEAGISQESAEAMLRNVVEVATRRDLDTSADRLRRDLRCWACSGLLGLLLFNVVALLFITGVLPWHARGGGDG